MRLSVRIPLIVAALMMLVGAVLSERVMDRLTQTQDRHLRQLGETYIDGLSFPLIPALIRDDVWEVFDIIDRSRSLHVGLTPIATVVTDAAGNVVAASDPDAHPTRSRLDPDFRDSFPADEWAGPSHAESRAFLRRELRSQDRTVGTVYAVLDTTHSVRERQTVLLTLVATNGVITLLLAGGGYLAVRYMVSPVRILTHHLTLSALEGIDPVPDGVVRRSRGEARRLFRSFNRLVDEVREKRDLASRLAAEERMATVGRLASGLAHEINNPLGGLLTAVDTLKRHGADPAVRERSVDLVERGLLGIRDVVRTTVLTYKVDESHRPLTGCDVSDLAVLLAPELDRRSLRLVCDNELPGPVGVPASPVRQALLNLLLNACAASPAGSTVAVNVRREDGMVVARVDDSGPGMPDEAVDYLTRGDGKAMPPPSGRGLGLWVVRRLAKDFSASITVSSSPLGGSRVELAIPVAEEVKHADAA
ncbi:sensor histidine kinase [Antarcticirhabdus aurantiaca]|uniref:HAMP domain-containing sensor histidine kinase n=1 Tax=Antarcticirhabdus aurantiaca TaxID=2606717 RepID=A0ACD4NIN6_9HYPH|nr:HAMP domain-containing sensor histidine kinase [Antarcticirhabdus aurantiaca]WAJ26657.1 HAMP domain-containing sensor histidine kinase [Jeongeuplla avenae]